MSYNSITNNVLLKITVPKRTGRKRKRGSQDPYTDDGRSTSQATSEKNSFGENQSHSLNDKPNSILRKLRDNVGKYTVEAAGAIEQSHRYRGSDLLLLCLQFINKIQDFPIITNLHLVQLSCHILKKLHSQPIVSSHITHISTMLLTFIRGQDARIQARH